MRARRRACIEGEHTEMLVFACAWRRQVIAKPKAE